MAKLISRLNHVRIQERKVIEEQIKRNNITLRRGRATILDKNTVSVSAADNKQKAITATTIIVATGSRPRRPTDVPFDGSLILDSSDILKIQDIPKSLIIVGAGVIGSEYATIFAALGTKVTLLDKGSRILGFLDSEISDFLLEHAPNRNISYIKDCRDIKIKHENGKAIAQVNDSTQYSADYLLFALGREANIEDLGMESVGINLNAYRYIPVNELYQTSVSNVYAIGDVIGWPSLAATSILQGRVAALNALNKKDANLPKLFPYGIYTIPEASYVGMTENEAREKKFNYVIGICNYSELPRGQISGELEGMVKMVVHADTREILGVHIVGSAGTEVIHTAQMAMLSHAKIDVFINNIFNYPTYTEGLKIAALSALNKLERL